MFIQRAHHTEERRSNGDRYHHHHRSRNHREPEGTLCQPLSTTANPKYSYQRSFPSTATEPSSGRAMISTASGSAAHCSFSSIPPPAEASKDNRARSTPPQSPTRQHRTAEALPGKSSLGVFLANYQMSGDFVQMKSDVTSANINVRLYLTATEIVKKTWLKKTRARGPGAKDLDFNIERYRLHDVQVSRSKVSPDSTLVITLLQSGEASASENANYSFLSNITTNAGASTETFSRTSTTVESSSHHGPAENGRHDSTHYNSNGRVRCCHGNATLDAATRQYTDDTYNDDGKKVVSVEAYRLRGDPASSVQDWIACIDKNKKKLDMLQRLKHTSAPAATTQASTIQESNSSSFPPLSPTRGGMASISPLPKSSSPARKWSKSRVENEAVLNRQSSSGFDVAAVAACSSPTREKFSNTTNGRYTPLHHNYSAHPLSSTSPLHLQNGHKTTSSAAAVQLRRRKNSGKEPFGLLRRLSLGAGSSGSYHFPPSPVDSPTSSENKTLHSRKNGTTKYMYSLSQDSTPNSTTPISMSPSASPAARRRKDSSPQKQTKASGKGTSWKQRRSIFSRSISEYSHESLNLSETEGGDEEDSTRLITIQQQRSTPLPDSTAADETDGIRYQAPVKEGSANDDNIPLELRALQSFLSSITSCEHSPPLNQNHPSRVTQQLSTSTSHSTQSDNEREEDDEEEEEEDDEAGFQSFLRHKQIRGRKIHVSPRVPSSELSAELLSPPAWVDKFPTLPISSPSPSPSPGTLQPDERQRSIKVGTSSTLPRGHKLKTDHTVSNGRNSRTLDRDGSSSPVPSKTTTSTVATTTTSSKAPKIFKKFHRRWQSSSGVKLEMEMISQPSTPESSLHMPSSTPPQSYQNHHHHQVDKLYLLPPREVAEGLTKMDAELMACIGPNEITDGAWMKRGQKEKLAPNILAMVQSFNQLALLVPTEVLGERTAQQRAKVISAYIQIASKCYYLKNFNSLKAILAGLQSTPVHRLRKTWKDIPSKKRKRFDRLCHLMSEDNNWEHYRNELDACLNTNTPCIPYLGQFLTQVCHQLSYDKMRAERDEVKHRRRSRSVLGTVEDKLAEKRTRERGNFRRRSKSFHRSSRKENGEVGSLGLATTIETSISTPVSPVASDDEREPPKLEEEGGEGEIEAGMRVKQASRSGAPDSNDDTQSLEFSLELDNHELHFNMSQPEPSSVVSHESPDQEEIINLNTSGIRVSHKRLSSELHSTPVKDANGYIKPLCSPVKLKFETLPPSVGYDEPDFNDPQELLQKPTTDSTLRVDQDRWVKEEKASEETYHMKIPSISLQQTSSHSSIDHDWDYDDEEEYTGGKITERRALHSQVRILKSRSLDSNLNHSMRAGDGRERNGTGDTLIHLTPSHSIPSLDSDSVFSGEEEQREREGEEAIHSSQEEKKGVEETEEEEEEEVAEEESSLPLRQKFHHIRMLQNSSFDRSLDSEMSTDEITGTTPNSTLPLSTSSTITTYTSPTNNLPSADNSINRPSEFSPASSSFELYTHSREQSLDNAAVMITRDNHDISSSSPSETPNKGDYLSKTSQMEDNEGVNKEESVEETDRKQKRRKKSHVNRSKSTSSSGNYRHKWRWKKAIALHSNNNNTPPLTNTSDAPSTGILNSADPFHLLQLYKDRSGECVTANSSQTDFRNILNRFNSNTETRNYELSFEREP